MHPSDTRCPRSLRSEVPWLLKRRPARTTRSSGLTARSPTDRLRTRRPGGREVRASGHADRSLDRRPGRPRGSCRLSVPARPERALPELRRCDGRCSLPARTPGGAACPACRGVGHSPAPKPIGEPGSGPVGRRAIRRFRAPFPAGSSSASPSCIPFHPGWIPPGTHSLDNPLPPSPRWNRRF